MNIDVITLFPEMFSALAVGITGRAIQQGLLATRYWNPRDFTAQKHQRVDDKPYGGGPGMVMQYQPLAAAIQAAQAAEPATAKVIYLSPQGQALKQATLRDWTRLPRLILVAGRYEGIDERLISRCIDEEWSIGDYILSGGELAAMVIMDAITRLLPGALGDEESAQQDSFSDGLLDYPHYTRPAVINGLAVPSVLTSGDHAAIKRWRLKQALWRTWQRRPELLTAVQLTLEQQQLLNEILNETKE